MKIIAILAIGILIYAITVGPLILQEKHIINIKSLQNILDDIYSKENGPQYITKMLALYAGIIMIVLIILMYVLN